MNDLVLTVDLCHINRGNFGLFKVKRDLRQIIQILVFREMQCFSYF